MGAQAVRLSNIDIDNALKNKDFEVLFQPIFDLGNGALARVETFLRWRHPSLGILPPGAFISFFETQGRMGELTRYVLSEAIDQYKAWRGANAPGFSINLAISDLADEAFSSHFAVLLRDSGYPADLITLECPMPPVTMDVETAAGHFRRLSETGARLAIEVRGRANDFLRQIDPFPFDEIKTGGSAILRFARTVRGPGLSAISELLDIAAKANAAITAVGVEDQASLAALRGLGFAAAQGNHLSKVGTLDEFSPSRVNDVRQLLGLKPLTADDLQALFRTEAPAPQPAAEPVETVNAPAASDDDLVERLAARLARQNAAAETPARAEQSSDKSASDEPAIDKKAAKAAAIARAKRKAAALTTDDAEDQAAATARQGALDAARSLQERLSREFNAMSDAEPDDRPQSVTQKAPEDDSVAVAETREDAMSDKKNNARSKPAAAVPSEEDAAEETTDASAEETAAEDPAADIAAPPADRAPEDDAAHAVEPAPPVSADASAAPHSPLKASLAVGETYAYFRPGLRVRGFMPGPAGAPAQPSAPSAAPSAAEPAAAAPASRPEPAEPASPAAEPPGQAAPAEDRGGDLNAEEDVGIVWEDAGEQAGSREASDAEVDTYTDEVHEAPAPRKRAANFLTRKYRLWPTHFWPKRLKRVWRRRRHEQLQRRLEREAETAGE